MVVVLMILLPVPPSWSRKAGLVRRLTPVILHTEVPAGLRTMVSLRDACLQPVNGRTPMVDRRATADGVDRRVVS